MGIEPAQAIPQGEEPEDWVDPDLQLPMDHSGMIEGILPLLGTVLFIGFLLVRSLP